MADEVLAPGERRTMRAACFVLRGDALFRFLPLRTPQSPLPTPSMTDPRYPIGKHRHPDSVSTEQRARFIDQIAACPAAMREAVRGLDDARLDTPYRDGGWTVRQVVHHVPDSHLQAYVRIKLALTEDEPTIKAYEEARWAELPEARSAPIEMSLSLLDAVHARWMAALRSLTPAHFARRYFHPQQQRHLSIDQTLALYAWHGRHHVAHIQTLREREGW